MNKKSIEDKFSIDMDAYFNGIEDPNSSNSQEYNEILKLGKTLAEKDFSKDSNKEAVSNRVLKNMNENKGDNNMKKLNKKSYIAKIASVAAVGVISVSLIKPAFAREIADKIIKTISLGHISVVQVESSKMENIPVPEEFKGKIFDKHGNKIEIVTKENAEDMYAANGEKIANLSNGEIITVEQEKKMRKEGMLELKDANELSDYLCFEAKLPSYLPEGYKFERAELYKRENGDISDKVTDLWFVNEKTGKTIYMQQRFASEEMGYADGTAGTVEEIKINGVDAVIIDDKSIDWEYKNVLYGLSGRGNISKDELIKIAESIK
ncbi:DUF4367 domain-containing protein [uncultured Clostridium sp.]|uniref:DUF4367 domain-containing protein n=1 Tax=uncultured Clostridium sp. TaxID=59620 RepID=UPI0028E2076D|nr:DUF4367 domain-containing protein [uncultured Clostridium sp.]